MGRTPIMWIPPALDPVQMLRHAYITGEITLEQFEDAIAEAIQGVWTKTTPLVHPKPPTGAAAGNTGKRVRA